MWAGLRILDLTAVGAGREALVFVGLDTLIYFASASSSTRSAGLKLFSHRCDTTDTSRQQPVYRGSRDIPSVPIAEGRGTILLQHTSIVAHRNTVVDFVSPLCGLERFVTHLVGAAAVDWTLWSRRRQRTRTRMGGPRLSRD